MREQGPDWLAGKGAGIKVTGVTTGGNFRERAEPDV